jgi:hypothetical protein
LLCLERRARGGTGYGGFWEAAVVYPTAAPELTTLASCTVTINSTGAD